MKYQVIYILIILVTIILLNTVKFENTRTGSLKFVEKLPDAPFFVKINQLLLL